MKSVGSERLGRLFASTVCAVFLALTDRPGLASIELGPFVNPANNSFYYQLAPATWDDARAEALSMGGDLVTVNNAAEDDWLWTTFDNDTDIFYTGLHFDSARHTFVWATGQPVTYVNFAPGEPDGFIHDGLAAFLGVNGDGEWGAVQKTQIHRSIVEVVSGCSLTGSWEGLSLFEDSGAFIGVMPTGHPVGGTRAGPSVSMSLSFPEYGVTFTFEGTMTECDVLVLHTTNSGPFAPFALIMFRSRPTYCGDNVVNGGEACDDGNFNPNDSCNAACQVSSPCGDGTVDPGEDCDDGNTIEKDACLSTCEQNACGDGHVRIGVEYCDDGNLTSGDGCSATCTLEPDTASGDVSVFPHVVATGDFYTFTNASDPIETGVWAAPNSTGTVTITEQSAAPAPATGFNVMGTIITITAPDLDPPPSPTNPVRVTFRIHKSIVPPGQSASSIQIRKDGVVLFDCDDSSPPCIASRWDDHLGILIDVLTPSFSDWDLSASICPPAALPSDCQRAGSAKLTLKEDGNADRLTWVWKSSLSTPASQFGQPGAANGYTLCLYDADGQRLQLNLPAGETCAGNPCWRATAKGFNYLDPAAATGGVRKLGLKAGDAGKAKLLLKALGPGLELPALPLTLPVTAQLRSQDGGCWQANFPAAQRNDASRFKARSVQP